MATIYKVRGPDGAIHRFSGPDNASPADVEAAASAQFGQTPKAPPAAAPPAGAGMLANMAGPAEAALHFGAGALGGLGGGLGYLGTLAGTGGDTDAAKAVQDAITDKISYQPSSTWGKQTAAAGDAALGSLGTGAKAVAGGLLDKGYQDPEMAGNADMSDPGNTGTVTPGMAAGLETGLNAATMALGPKGKPKAAAPGLPKVMNGIDQIVAANGKEYVPPTPPLRDTLVAANKAGLRVTPKYGKTTDMGAVDNLAANAASTGGSEVKLQQALSQHNVGNVVPDLVKKELGIPDETPFSPAAVNEVDAKVGKVYDLVRNAGEVAPTDAFKSAIDNLGSRTAAQRHYFGSGIDPAIKAMQDKYSGMGTVDAGALLDEIKDLRDSARGNYKQMNDINKSRGLGHAQMQAATALEDLLMNHLEGSGAPVGTAGPMRGLASAFKDARTTKAKLETVRNAMNDASGEISPAALAREYNEGGGANGPMTGNLKTIAEAQQAFPKVMQDTARLPTSHGPTAVDLALAGHGIISHNPLAMAAAALRPVGRSRVNTQSFQDAMVNPPGPQGMSFDQMLAAARTNPATVPFLFGNQQQDQDR